MILQRYFMRKKLLVVVGAGASLDFGMPSVKKIDLLFEEWAKEILILKEDSNKSLYTWIKNILTDYASQNSNSRIDYMLNFENIIYTAQVLYAINTDRESNHFNQRLTPFVVIKELPEIIRFKREKIADGYDFHFLQSYLIDKLLEHFRELCKEFSEQQKKDLGKLNFFFNSLKADFQIGIINLNYDNIILKALPDLETGFDKATGEFQRERFFKDYWNFCYHLHGSVHFDSKGNATDVHKIYWEENLTSDSLKKSSTSSGFTTTEGINHMYSSIILGLDKTNQILREPFGSYFMQLDRLIYEADAILFIGYGFADHYLNKAFPFIRQDTKRRKVVIIDWANENQDGLNFRQDDWTFGLFATIPYNGFEMGYGKKGMPECAAYYKRKKILEKSSNPDYPLAIWYDGILEAFDYVDKIKEELS